MNGLLLFRSLNAIGVPNYQGGGGCWGWEVCTAWEKQVQVGEAPERREGTALERGREQVAAPERREEGAAMVEIISMTSCGVNKLSESTQ